MKCGFEEKECTEKCKYFHTCVRNPYRKEQDNGRSKVDKAKCRNV